MRPTPRALRPLALSLVAAAATVTMTAAPAVAAPGGHGHGKGHTSGGSTTSPSPSTSTGSTTYRDFTYTSNATAPTADKPQSKLWYVAGAWWALMLSPADGAVHVFELRSDHTWRDTGTVVDTRSNSTGDALWDGTHLYVASRAPDASGLYVTRLSYLAGSRSWSVDSGFPVSVKTGSMESATIAKDTTGMLWVTFTQGDKVFVKHTSDADNHWAPSYVVPVADTAVSYDDISAVIAFDGKIGVFWSNQNTGTFDFAIHRDGDPDSAWTREVPESGDHLADDHMNVKSLVAGDDGRLYVAVKTSRNDVSSNTSEPIIQLLTRSADGTWRAVTYGTVGTGLTRPELLIDEADGQLYLFATAPEDGGTIYYKSTSLTSPSFGTGRGTPFITYSGAVINNISTTKQTVSASTGIVAIAADSAAHRYYHAEMPISGVSTADTVAPSVPAGTTATADSARSVSLSWQPATDNVAVTGYDVFRDGSRVATVAQPQWTDATVQPSTTYHYTLDAFDAAGNHSTQGGALDVTTPAAPPQPSLRSQTTAVNNNAATLTLPATGTTQAGDLLVATIAARGSRVPVAPTGWTLADSQVNGSVIITATFVHTATSTEPSSYTFTLASTRETGVGTLLDYADVTGVDVANGRASGASYTITAPGVVTTATGDLLLGVFATAAAADIPAPDGMDVAATVSSPGTTYKIALTVAAQQLGAAGGTGDRSTRASLSAANDGQLIALLVG